MADERRSSWLSLGFEDFVASLSSRGSEAHPIDVLIVGSGYGGSVAAAELAGTRTKGGDPVEVVVLERGSEYLEGAFPSSADEVAGHMRFSTPGAKAPAGRAEGLFDVRLGPDLGAVVANGLGGGSLINAGVMLEPVASVVDSGFPAAIGGHAGLAPFFAEARTLLGAKTVSSASDHPKARALKAMAAGNPWGYVPITVAVNGAGQTSANVELKACISCGDCASGCNYGAKESLDLNLLARAAHCGARLYTGATVLRLERHRNGGWIVHAVPTERPLRDRQRTPSLIHASRVILAAGTFGSTEILLRSRGDALKLPDALGRRFSSNGDFLAAVYDHDAEANAVADERIEPSKRGIGPTITSMIDLRGDPDENRRFAIQEVAIPGALRRLFEEIFTTAKTLYALPEADLDAHSEDSPEHDPCAVDRDAIRHTTALAVMGDDKAEGSLELDPRAEGDGEITVRWPGLRTGSTKLAADSVFDRQTKLLEKLVSESLCHGKVLPNPGWKLLPPKLAFLMDDVRGPPLTVHPLGGCAMGDDAEHGVVNHLGQVFDVSNGAKDEVFGGLVVLDGSIIPRALGINPALTITSVALRAVRLLRDRWSLDPPDATPLPSTTRPVFEVKRHVVKPEPTFAIAERLTGEATLRLPGETRATRKVVELTLHYHEVALSTLMGRMKREVIADPSVSRVRVFDAKAYRLATGPNAEKGTRESRLAKLEHLSARLEGRLRFLHREPTTVVARRCRAFWGWVRNRGLRDSVQGLYESFTERGAPKREGDSACDRLHGALRLATRAGEVRRFDYELRAFDAKWHDDGFRDHAGDGAAFEITGHKRLTYGRLANLWQQLEQMTLTRLGDCRDPKGLGVLDIDLEYFAEAKTPLARFATQPNLPASMFELGCFGAYLLRVLINIHLWSFRRPESPKPRAPDRLPGPLRRFFIDGVLRYSPPRPRITEFTQGELPNGQPVRMRLSRYANFESTKVPVLLIHGYSASGTTFAHPAVRPNLVETLWRAQRDVWVIDMRTSSGMPTAAEPWAFEDAALEDIPVAIDHILRETGWKKLDVVAHCMGGAMLSMAVLKAPVPGDRFFDERAKLPDRIRHAVLSQVGPRVQFSPINTFRAYVMRYMRHYLGVASWDFRIPDSPSMGEQLADRFLSSLRYPVKDLRIENSCRFWRRSEYIGTRHRIDALYGRTFTLANMTERALSHIDDLFGPLSLETIAQPMHFAKHHVVTDRKGRNIYLNRSTRERWKFPTLSLHARDNGLVSPATRDLIHDYFNRDDNGNELPEPIIKTRMLEGVGHQDCLIGKREATRETFETILEFLDEDGPEERSARAASRDWLAVPPWIGPHRGPAPGDGVRLRIAAACDPKLGDARFVACVRVKRHGDRFRIVSARLPWGGEDGGAFVFPANCDRDGWLSLDLPQGVGSAGADGFLILLLHDQPQRFAESAPKAAELDSLIGELQKAGYGLPLEMTSPSPPAAPPQVVMHDVMLMQFPAAIAAAVNLILERIRAMLQGMPALLSLRAGIEKALADRSAADLEAAMISGPPARGSTIVMQVEQESRVLVGSCQYPAGLLDDASAWRSYRRMRKLAEGELALLPDTHKLLLLLGDQIYSDATAGLFDPAILDDKYRRPHEALFSQPDVKAVLRRMPSAMMLDDHELSDNWEAGMPRAEERLREGKAAYKDFQRRAGPTLEDPVDDSKDPLWFKGKVGDVPVFVADTRTERRPPRRGEAWPRIMSHAQQDKLEKWLIALASDPDTSDAPKLIASPSILLPMRLAGKRRTELGSSPSESTAGWKRIDAWQGYPNSFASLLHCIVEHEVRNVIFLSGDEHLFCVATAEVTRRTGPAKSARIASVHSSPLYAPYPFANASPADFDDGPKPFSFTFAPLGATPIVYDCAVSTTFCPVAQGFAELQARRTDGKWSARVGFHDAVADAVHSWHDLVA